MDHGEFYSRLIYLLLSSLHTTPDDRQLRTRIEIELGFAFIQAWTQIVRQDLKSEPESVTKKMSEIPPPVQMLLEKIDEKQLFIYPFQPEFQVKFLYIASILWILEKPQLKSLRNCFIPQSLQATLSDSGFHEQFESLIVRPHLRTAHHTCSRPGDLRQLAEYLQKNFVLSPQLNHLLYRSLDRLSEIDLERHPTHPGLEFDFSADLSVRDTAEIQEKQISDSSVRPDERSAVPFPSRILPNTVPDWGKELVILAKLLPVWLHQLSVKYQRPITTIAEIPDEEFSEMKRLHISGLWLVGIWERSPASKKIKQSLGNPYALASAYSIHDYQIDPALGGNEALKVLKEKAARFGIHLGADVIPNHTAIDSHWVQQHPEWFVSSESSPFPSYSFLGNNLSQDEHIDIRIEDHYYDRQDAAVVFRYHNRSKSDQPLYIYHGNDGTHVPWNDTAQLNYLNPEVRRKMIDTIIAVSKDFPLIRLDAAMTLTRLHYKRLWFPPPGEGGAIPSRSGKISSHDEFDSLYGDLEFWQDVLTALNRENPQALLLAEAFWLMEPYFINHIGMHKVYHSAFMNILRDYPGHKFNEYLNYLFQHYPKTTLNHYVNFLSTPDEAPAAVSFGKGDRFHAASILLCTFPGTPLFAHSQWDGLEEQYGMEFAAPIHNLPSDKGFFDYYSSILMPVLSNRRWFSDAHNFMLQSFTGFGDEKEKNVICYSNRFENNTVYVVVNYQDSEINGKISTSVDNWPAIGSIQNLAQSYNTMIEDSPFKKIRLGPWGFCIFIVTGK